MCEFQLKDFVLLSLNIVVVTGFIKEHTKILCDLGITMSKSKHEIVFLSLLLVDMNTNYDRTKNGNKKQIESLFQLLFYCWPLQKKDI